MDFQKEREAFEDWFSCNAIRDHEYVRGERMDENGNYYSEYAYLAWSAWQAAKAQAVPENTTEKLESTANFMRGMCFDPRLHHEIKEAITERVAEIDSFVEEYMDELLK